MPSNSLFCEINNQQFIKKARTSEVIKMELASPFLTVNINDKIIISYSLIT